MVDSGWIRGASSLVLQKISPNLEIVSGRKLGDSKTLLGQHVAIAGICRSRSDSRKSYAAFSDAATDIRSTPIDGLLHCEAPRWSEL